MHRCALPQPEQHDAAAFGVIIGTRSISLAPRCLTWVASGPAAFGKVAAIIDPAYRCYLSPGSSSFVTVVTFIVNELVWAYGLPLH